VAGEAVLESQPCGKHGATHRQPGSLHQGSGSWQTDAPLLGMGEFAVGKGLVVARLMD
jgi:hypothetical protein